MSDEPNCLLMCSLCAKPVTNTGQPLKKCGACKLRTYCDKKCQIIDWKVGGHKRYCGTADHPNSVNHQPWCAYLDRDPELDAECLVETHRIKTNPRELITTGMNTCMLLVIKTPNEITGWHASSESLVRYRQQIQRKLSSIAKEDCISIFLVPGEDREKDSLVLKRTCRTMRELPWTDPCYSRDLIFNFLKQFTWFEDVQIMSPVDSYKDFVVFDMAHKRPYSFSNPALFDQGCAFDANVDESLARMSL